MRTLLILVASVAFAGAGCSDQRTSVVNDDSGQTAADGGQTGGDDAGYELTYCEDGEVRTATCSGGICDPAPFEVCDDGSCVLAPQTCAEEPPPGAIIEVTVRNAGIGTIYVDGLKSMPFSIEDSSGTTFQAASVMAQGSCDECDEICANNLHGDPAPCYIELPPGGNVTVSWSGLLYTEQSCPSCYASCYEASALQPGDYTFVVPFRTNLDQLGYEFTETRCTSIEDATSWMGNGIGMPEFDQQAEIAVTYSGQGELSLQIE